MKLLQELLYTDNTLAEGQVDPHVLMSIDNIIKNGKISETFQTIALARMLEYFKNGIFYKEQNFFDPFVSTSKALLDTLRALDPEDAVALAKKMRELLEIKDKDLLNRFVNPEQEAIAYIKFVTSREAND
jgi:hypothetical protein